MIVLVLNSGSSSLKFQLLEMPREAVLASGRVERIGEPEGEAIFFCRSAGGDESRTDLSCPDHRAALGAILNGLTDPGRGCLSRLEEIGAVGHRVVHGRDLFAGPCLVTGETLTHMRRFVELAPLQMPPSLACVEACGEILPGVSQVAHFDTGFHQSMPDYAYRYAVPEDWYRRYGVRRYGFHGLSHEYVTRAASHRLGIPLDRIRLITAHLGNGASITAYREGGVLDTSMGFTPLEGLVMGTRAGVLDPAVIPYIMSKTGRSAADVLGALNHESGLQAVSGVGRDMRDILAARARGDARAALAFRMYIHVLRKYTGAYHFALGGTDAFVFTGGVGENAPDVREALFQGLAPLGFEVDPDRNRTVPHEEAAEIGTPASRVRILVIPTNEEVVIARAACRLLAPAPRGPGDG